MLVQKTRLVLFVFTITTCLFACDKKPSISKHQMAKILLDLQTADAYTLFTASDSDKLSKLLRNKDSLDFYYASVWKHYKIDTNIFKENMDWYANHPAELDSVVSIMEKTALSWNK